MTFRYCMCAFWAAALAVQAQQPQPSQPMRLTLDEARRLAIQNNPSFSAARYTAAAAYQVESQYRANYAPTVFGSFTGVGADNGTRIGAGALNNPVVYNRLGSGLSINQLLTDFGRTSNLVGMARLQAQAQDQATEGTRADILLVTSQSYFQVLRAQAVLKVAQQTVAARQLVADQVSALAQSNLRSNLDVSFANVNVSDAKLLQVQTENDIHSAEAALAAAMGLPGVTEFSLSEEALPGELPAKVADLIAQAVDQRPELRELRLQETAAERFARAEHDLNYPTLGVTGTAGFVPTSENGVVPPRYGAVGLNITIPVFNGGLYRARQAEAELKARATGQNISDLQNRVARDVRVAYLNAATARDRMSLTQQMEDQARMALELAQGRYDLGLSNIVELSLAQLNLTAAQIANANARYDYQTQRVLVDYQIGALR